MGRIHKPPYLFEPPKGISSDSIFVYGPDMWVEKLLAELKPLVGVNILLSDYSSDYPLWDYEAIAESDTALFYLKGTGPQEIVLSYLSVAAWAQFPPEVFVYQTTEFYLHDEVEYLVENMKNRIKLVDNAKDMVKIGVDAFDYLKEDRG